MLVSMFISNSSADDLTLFNEAKSISPQIDTVFVCGSWEYKEKRGTFRIISGWIYGHTELYVQWLKESYTPGTIKVESTISFPRFNHYEEAVDLSNIRCTTIENGVKLDMHMSDGHSDKERNVSILLFNEPGKYQKVGFDR
jgi:hypothetical protein